MKENFKDTAPTNNPISHTENANGSIAKYLITIKNVEPTPSAGQLTQNEMVKVAVMKQASLYADQLCKADGSNKKGILLFSGAGQKRYDPAKKEAYFEAACANK